jgi:hypothetical protein
MKFDTFEPWETGFRLCGIELVTFAAPFPPIQSSLTRSIGLGIHLLPEDIRATYQIEERHHACAILKLDFPAEWDVCRPRGTLKARFYRENASRWN